METFINIILMIYEVVYRTLTDTFMHFVPPLVCKYWFLLLIVGIPALIWGYIYFFRREDEADIIKTYKGPTHLSGDN